MTKLISAVLTFTLLLTPAAEAAVGDTILISRQSDSLGGAPADSGVHLGSVSADGRYVAFESWANNLSDADLDRTTDIYVRDTVAGATTLVSRQSTDAGGSPADADSTDPAISADGRFVAFTSRAGNLSPDLGAGGEEAVYLRDLAEQRTILVSRQAEGRGGRAANRPSRSPAISGNGRYVGFVSKADNLSRRASKRYWAKVFLRDTKRNRTMLVSRASARDGGAPANHHSGAPSVSDNGRFVAFESTADNLARADAGKGDGSIYLRDVSRGRTRLNSRRSGREGKAAGCCSKAPAISADGRHVAFTSSARNLAPPEAPHGSIANVAQYVYVRDVERPRTELVSRDGGVFPDGLTEWASISGDGRLAVFHTMAGNLSPVATGISNVFLRDRAARTTELVSEPAPSRDGAFFPAISASGRFVAFDSNVSGVSHVFLRQVR